MTTRSDVIARTDAETDRLVAEEGRLNRTRMGALVALVMKPKLAGLVGTLSGGVEAGIDRWAFALTLEAKRYERDFGNDDGPKSLVGTFGA